MDQTQMYKRSIDDPDKFWGEIASQFYWEKKVSTAALLEPFSCPYTLLLTCC